MSIKLVSSLVPGDRIYVHSGIVRTVAEVVDSGYRGIVGNRPILYVRYRPFDPTVTDAHWAERADGHSFADNDPVRVTP